MPRQRHVAGHRGFSLLRFTALDGVTVTPCYAVPGAGGAARTEAGVSRWSDATWTSREACVMRTDSRSARVCDVVGGQVLESVGLRVGRSQWVIVCSL